MQSPPHLAPVGRATAAARRVVGAAQLDDLAPGVADRFATGHEIGVAEARLAPRRQAMELARGIRREIVALDVELAGEGDAADARSGILGVVGGLEPLGPPGRVVVDGRFQRAQHRHAPRRAAVEDVAHAMFERFDLHRAVALVHPDHGAEFADRPGRNAASAQTGESGHARVVPSRHPAARHRFREPSFRQHRVREVEAGELVLPRPRRRRKMFDQPVVQGPVVFELEGADRMGHPLDRVRLAVRVIVCRVDAPLVAGARVGAVKDAVEHRVPQVEVARRHVDAGPQHAAAFGECAGAHLLEQLAVLVRRAVAPRAFGARFGQRPPGGADLPGGLVVHIGEAVVDQAQRPGVEGVEMVRGEAAPVPLEAEPAQVAFDRLGVAAVLADGVGVVEAQVAAAAERRGDAEIQANGFGVADMEIAVGFRREAGDDPGDAAGGEVGGDGPGNEIAWRGRRGHSPPAPPSASNASNASRAWRNALMAAGAPQ